jgi:acyl-CoA dehydrogenase
MGERTDEDSGMAVLTTLIAMGQTWGDYSVRMRRNERGLGNSALQAAGTPEQKRKWGDLILAMAIPSPAADRIRRWCAPPQRSTATTGC